MLANTTLLLRRVALLTIFSVFLGSTVSAQTLQPARPNLVIPATDVMQVGVRKSDSLINGALLGAGAAVATGLFICTRMEPWRNCRDDYGPMLRLGAIGAGIGAGIDLLLRDRMTIYDGGPGSTRVHAKPIINRDARGLQVAVRF